MEIVFIPLLLLVGSLLSLQAGANVQLASATHSPFGASALQLGLGAVLLLALAAVLGTLGSLDLSTTWRPGTCSAGSAPRSTSRPASCSSPGSARSCPSGCSWPARRSCRCCSTLTGWLGVDRRGARRAGAVGALAMLVGIALIVRAQEGRVPAVRAGSHSRSSPAPCFPLQGAINAQLRSDLDAPIAAGAWSFVTAAAAMLVVLAVARVPGPRLAGLPQVPWWGWLGAVCGATYVTSVFLLIPELGVAPTIGLTIAGQQIASVFVDRYGLLRLPQRSISNVRLAGVAALLAGVAAIQFT